MGDLIDVLSTWFSGRQTTSITLWGLPMLWWGRIGKCLQFVAGCAVVLDLIGAQRLRTSATRAIERRNQASARSELLREVTELAKVKRAVIEQVMVLRYTTGHTTRPVPDHWAIAPYPWGPNPRPEWFSRLGLSTLRSRTIFGLPDAHDCIDDHPERLCGQQVGYVNRQVDTYLLANVPPHEQELLSKENEFWRSERLRIHSTVMLTLAFLPLPFLLTGPFLGICVLLFFVIFFTLLHDDAWLRLRFAPIVMGSRIGSTLLERLLPGNRIRWAAFILFVAGFGLDVLAS